MAWLMRDGRVLASCAVLERRADRVRAAEAGELDGTGAVLRPRARLAHSLRAAGAIDVALLDGSGVVLKLVRLRRGRLGGYRRGTCAVLEAEAGAFERWGLRLGDTLEVRE